VSITRHALPQDRDAAIATLAEAFSTDPFWVYLLAGDDLTVPDERMTPVMELEHDLHVLAGHTYVIGDDATALWDPPGVHTDLTEVGGFLARYAPPERMARAMEAFAEIADWRPTEPHFYLHLIGARSQARGQGLGSALLGRVLSICDDEGLPAFLEASSARNAELYTRHGFTNLATVTIDTDVALRAMVRPPKQ